MNTRGSRKFCQKFEPGQGFSHGAKIRKFLKIRHVVRVRGVNIAAGLALRIVLYEFSLPAFGDQLRNLMRSQNLDFVGLEQVAARAVGRIGSCGGGPVRSALRGWGVGWLPRIAATAAKGVLIVLPALATAQWGLRAAKSARRLWREVVRQGGARRIKVG